MQAKLLYRTYLLHLLDAFLFQESDGDDSNFSCVAYVYRSTLFKKWSCSAIAFKAYICGARVFFRLIFRCLL